MLICQLLDYITNMMICQHAKKQRGRTAFYHAVNGYVALS